MGKKYDFRYIVIGSGPAGSTTALRLAEAKKSVAIIEGHFFGGSELNTRDVPYSVALDFSHHYNNLFTYPELQNQDISFNLPTISARELNTVIKVGGNDKKRFENAGIVCLAGYANFLDPHTVAVNQKKFTAEHFIIATGSHLKISEISGTEIVQYLTPDTAIKSHHLPKVVAVVGGGASGCEIAEYFAELGSKVVLLEMTDHLLPREDQEVGDLMSEYFNRQLDLTVLLNSKVVALEEDSLSKRVIFRYDNTEKMVRVDTIVLATGSEPNLDLGLENAGVKFKNTGITVNNLFQASTKHIYAIGDCIGNESSTDRAYLEGFNLSSNLINKSKTLTNYNGLIRLVNTYPEIATVGFNENDLARRDRKHKKAFIPLDETIASQTLGCEYGFIKLLTDKTGHIFGATIVSPHAGLIAEEISLAIRHNLTTMELASTPHLIGSYNYLVKLAAKKLLPRR
ncbi:NAD(P)/FAD-dependent oxidoreductase [Candidatus Saccharibacteria bacterium]|nr:NAD(P)/FAD-dependent oxidoreductase [Candidatus Saccharibacteria bacterium]